MTPEPPQDPRDFSKDPRNGYGATAPPPAFQGIPQGIPPEEYGVPSGQYQAFPGAYGPYGNVQPYGPPTNVLAIVSLISSLVAALACGIGSVVAIVCGHVALNQIQRSGEAGRGMAIAGLVLGYLGLLATVGAALFFLTAD
jgi:hypothetical protein